MIKKIDVISDIGHGIHNKKWNVYDPGAVDPKSPGDPWDTKEYDLNKVYSKNFVNALKRRGVSSSEISGPLSLRDDKANASKAKAGVSHHCNSSRNISARGLYIYCFNSKASVKLASNIAEYVSEVCKTFKIPYKGIHQERFHMLVKTNAPWVLMEYGFVSNNVDEAILHNPEFQKTAAAAVAAGVCKFLGITNVTTSKPLQTVSRKKIIYSKGDRGGVVKAYQQKINKLIRAKRVRRTIIAEDGIFGRQTETAVRATQRYFGITVDGIIGPQTMKKLI